MLHVTERAGDRVVAQLPEDVDLHSTPGLRAVGDRMIDEGCRHLTLDCSGTLYLDSTGISAIVVWYQRLDAVGGSLTLSEVNEHLYSLLTRLGLHTAITITPGTATSDKQGS
ncbi:STAS domain-containing protein [Streptomyces sp. 900105755]|uniref:STAS domain-containing protein n=1 Tax=unclassified Streptomyces TaxID=2593676 RepID=UPI0008967254|nr:STAS domain-containing protein [Streptomyces sp. Ag109_O5-10]SEE39791.1 anti-anti-sigma factor [Streptomyces sp. Ag109_O5-10]